MQAGLEVLDSYIYKKVKLCCVVGVNAKEDNIIRTVTLAFTRQLFYTHVDPCKVK